MLEADKPYWNARRTLFVWPGWSGMRSSTHELHALVPIAQVLADQVRPRGRCGPRR